MKKRIYNIIFLKLDLFVTNHFAGNSDFLVVPKGTREMSCFSYSASLTDFNEILN